MSILELMKRDANAITTNTNEFSQAVTFISPDAVEAVVNGLHTKHHLGYDLETAQEINTLKAHVCVSEQELIALGYPVRDVNNHVKLKGHKVKAKDANGLLCTYVVQEFFPNDVVGTISLILGIYVPGTKGKIFDGSFDETFE
jgi:hypothetical protein